MKDGLKVLHVSTAKSWRGGEQQLAYLMAELNDQGIQQMVVCPSQSKLATYCKRNNINYVSNEKPKLIGISCALRLKKIVRKYKPDLVHVHDAKAHTYSFLTSLVSNLFPGIVVSRKVDFKLKNNFLTKAKYNHIIVKKIICVSDAIKEIVAEKVKDDKKLITIYDGVCLNKYRSVSNNILRQEYNIPENLPIIGCVAALVDHKDHITFINTASCLKRKSFNAKYVLVGDGKLKSKLVELVENLGLSNDFIFCGSRSDVPEILPEFDCFLLTSKMEGLCQSVLEAMACKVPVVSSSSGGLKEIVIHNKTGLLGQPGNEDEFATNILNLFDNTKLKDQLIDTAYSFVQGFSDSIMAAKTLEVYQLVLNNVNFE